MKKAMFIMLILVGILFGGIFSFKEFVSLKQKEFLKTVSHKIFTITATTAETSKWQRTLKIAGSLRTVKGVNVTTELGGMIRQVLFQPGTDVQQGQVLVRLDIDPEVAKLHQLQAQYDFAHITYIRNQKQYKFGAISEEQLDSDRANDLSYKAQVEEQKAIIEKKIVRAPFSGRIGISLVYPGEYINPGTAVTNLQTIDPIYVDFYIPQRQISDIKLGQGISMTLDSTNKKIYYGQITTVNPMADTDVRNIEVEATLANPKYELLPGMFSNVEIKVGNPTPQITLPATAVTFNPFGSIAFLLTKTKDVYKGKAVWKCQEKFVTTGLARGNQISVLSGISEGDLVVTSGQLKLRNGSSVVIDNAMPPASNPNPTPGNEE